MDGPTGSTPDFAIADPDRRDRIPTLFSGTPTVAPVVHGGAEIPLVRLSGTSRVADKEVLLPPASLGASSQGGGTVARWLGDAPANLRRGETVPS